MIIYKSAFFRICDILYNKYFAHVKHALTHTMCIQVKFIFAAQLELILNCKTIRKILIPVSPVR
jgi:hypothetical protein